MPSGRMAHNFESFEGDILFMLPSGSYKLLEIFELSYHIENVSYNAVNCVSRSEFAKRT